MTCSEADGLRMVSYKPGRKWMTEYFSKKEQMFIIGEEGKLLDKKSRSGRENLLVKIIGSLGRILLDQKSKNGYESLLRSWQEVKYPVFCPNAAEEF